MEENQGLRNAAIQRNDKNRLEPEEALARPRPRGSAVGALSVFAAAVLALSLLLPGGAAAAPPQAAPQAHAAKHKKCKKKHKCKHHATPAPAPGSGSSSGDGGGSSSPTLQPAPKLDVVPSDQVLQLPSGGDPTLIVAGSHDYSPGQYLSAAPGTGAPDGFLLKVVSSQIVDGNTVVQTEPGSLYDAVPNGEINADLSNATPVNASASKISRAVSAPSGEEDDVPFDEHVICTSGAQMELNGSMNTSFAPHFDLKWHKFLGAPTGVDKASATVDASISASVSAGVTASAGCTLDDVTLLDPKWRTVIPVGEMLVPVIVDIPITVSGSASVSGQVSVQADASANGSLGVEYKDGHLSPVQSFSADASLSHSASANATLEGKIGAEVKVLAGWQIPVIGQVAADVGVGADTGLKLTYDTTADPRGKLCVPFTISGEVGLHLPLETVETGKQTLYDTNIKCINWDYTSGLHWVGTISYSESDSWIPGWDASSPPSTFEQSASASWQVDAHTPEGYTAPSDDYDNSEPLDYSDSSWHANSVLGSYFPCGPTYHHRVETWDIGGAGPPNGQGALPYTELLHIYLTPTSYGFYSLGAYGGGTRTVSGLISGLDCLGLPPEVDPVTGVNLQATGACLPNTPEFPRFTGTLARVGTHAAGTVSGTDPCTTQSAETHYGWTYDLTVTCVDGSAPNPDWTCGTPASAEPASAKAS